MKQFIHIPDGAEYDVLPVLNVPTPKGQVQSTDISVLRLAGFRKQLPPQTVMPGFVALTPKLVDVDGLYAQYQITQIPQAEYDKQQSSAQAAADQAAAAQQQAQADAKASLDIINKESIFGLMKAAIDQINANILAVLPSYKPVQLSDIAANVATAIELNKEVKP
jgi:cbb3-type cytochrome oxidase cytochrome c subunit